MELIMFDATHLGCFQRTLVNETAYLWEILLRYILSLMHCQARLIVTLDGFDLRLFSEFP